MIKYSRKEEFEILLNKSTKMLDQAWLESSEGHLFYSHEHIEDILLEAKRIGKGSGLSDTDILKIQSAASFLITGFISNSQRPRSTGIKKLLKHLHEWSINEETIEEMRQLAEDSNDDIYSHVLHDAFNAHKGKKGFFSKMGMLKIEKERSKKEDYFSYDWERIIYRYLKYTDFKTAYAKKKYHERWRKNIFKQSDKMRAAYKKTIRLKTGKELGRGIDTLYRTSYSNHINLSSIADGKANMMISINTIILSVIVTLSGASFTLTGNFIIEHWRFTIPIFVLLSGCLLSVIFAVLSARPRVTTKKVNEERLESGKSSVLFFGNFLKVSRQSFVNHLSRLKEDHNKLYDNMSTDLYYLGAVLKLKYKMLTWSYTIFVIGLALSVVSFVVTFLYTNLSNSPN
ncbi:MAG: DUF5706 domain-containing protein [Cyclobacteriaceae bacterium]